MTCDGVGFPPGRPRKTAKAVEVNSDVLHPAEAGVNEIVRANKLRGRPSYRNARENLFHQKLFLKPLLFVAPAAGAAGDAADGSVVGPSLGHGAIAPARGGMF